MVKQRAPPVDGLPGVREVGDYLDVDEDLLLDVDDADHLMEVLARVRKELFHLKVALQLMELLDLWEQVHMELVDLWQQVDMELLDL